MTKTKRIKGQQRSTKHTHKIKDRVTRTHLHIIEVNSFQTTKPGVNSCAPEGYAVPAPLVASVGLI
jgi:hypothetical protein